MKTEVRKRLGTTEPHDVSVFSVRYEAELKKKWTESSQTELLKRLESSTLVYGGDFHALAQAQRTHLRLLRALSSDRPVTLALECFQASTQKHLNQFLSGRLTTDELRVKANWDQSWGFPWDHYRPLLELARSRGWQLLALNSRTIKKLDERERRASVLIKRAHKKERLLYVIFGDLHLAPEHLPKKVGVKNSLTIHLNSERVYFQLAKQGREHAVDTVKFNDHSFCILSTPPWVKWQSYLLFLEQNQESDEWFEDETDFDPTDQVALLVRLAASDLGVAKNFAQINDLAVYGDHDETIWRLISRKTHDGQREIAQSLLRSGQRFFIPQGGIAYQPKPTINSGAALAGFYLHARLSKRKRTLWNFPNDLRAAIWTEAVSYLISKMINHGRRSDTIEGLQKKLKVKSENKEALRLALDFRLSEIIRRRTGRKRDLQIQPRRKSSYAEASRILGGMLGERLYAEFRSRKLRRTTLLAWLRVDPGSRAFAGVYERIINGIETR